MHVTANMRLAVPKIPRTGACAAVVFTSARMHTRQSRAGARAHPSISRTQAAFRVKSTVVHERGFW